MSQPLTVVLLPISVVQHFFRAWRRRAERPSACFRPFILLACPLLYGVAYYWKHTISSQTMFLARAL